MEENNPKPKIFYVILIILITINIIFFLSVILNLPDFMLDDYQLFYIIDKNPHSIVLQNPDEIIHLSVRPLTYFSFWLDYNVFHLTPLQMKLETLLLHICLLVLAYYFIYDLCSYLKLKTNIFIIGLTLLIISLHTVSMWWLIWLQQRNELIMLIFYFLALYMVLQYLIHSKTFYLFLYVLLYALSILAKQQSLHLPLLLLFLLVLFKNKLSRAA